MAAELNIPIGAVRQAEKAVLEYDSVGSFDSYEIARDAVQAAAPLIVAADYEQFAAKMREALRQLPEYTVGSLAWRVMNDIDTHIAELRGEQS